MRIFEQENIRRVAGMLLDFHEIFGNEKIEVRASDLDFYQTHLKWNYTPDLIALVLQKFFTNGTVENLMIYDLGEASTDLMMGEDPILFEMNLSNARLSDLRKICETEDSTPKISLTKGGVKIDNETGVVSFKDKKCDFLIGSDSFYVVGAVAKVSVDEQTEWQDIVMLITGESERQRLNQKDRKKITRAKAYINSTIKKVFHTNDEWLFWDESSKTLSRKY
ncbi:MAG TPA: hypothetical protein VJK72_05950 [Candidatus Nanoarchaeia archaeon]|nr:hypothetical protein [Candidatus Nanoarchaeia archaeon]